MKTRIRILMAVLTIAVAACSKKEEEVVPVPTAGYSSLEDFEQDVKLEPQTFQINNVTGGTVTGNEGTHLTFPDNAFIHQNGTIVTGIVNVTLYEANKKSEMVLGGIYTATATIPLISGGQFKFVASQNGQQLKFAPGKKAAVTIPSVNPDNNMSAFTQITSASNFSYTAAGDSSAWLYSDGTQYIGFTDSMIWVNCDHPFIQADYRMINVKTLSGIADVNCKVVIVFKNINTVVRIYWDAASASYKYPYAPVGYEATIIGIGVKDGNLYSAFAPVTFTNDQIINMALNGTTRDQLNAHLDDLN